MDGEMAEICYSVGGISASQLWESVKLGVLSCGGPVYLSRGSGVKELSQITVLDGELHFRMEGEGWEFDFTPLTNYDICVFTVKSKLPQGIPYWRQLVPYFAHSSFLIGRLCDVEYNFWQNAQDLLQFASAGREHAHLPRISNGLPYPFSADIIDISRNPGRQVLVQGMVLATGAVMWFGNAFWSRCGCTPESIANFGGATRVLNAGVYEALFYDKLYSSAEGTEGSRQEALRHVLFDKL